VTNIKFNSYLPKYNTESTVPINAAAFVFRSTLLFWLDGAQSRHIYVCVELIENFSRNTWCKQANWWNNAKIWRSIRKKCCSIMRIGSIWLRERYNYGFENLWFYKLWESLWETEESFWTVELFSQLING